MSRHYNKEASEDNWNLLLEPVVTYPDQLWKLLQAAHAGVSQAQFQIGYLYMSNRGSRLGIPHDYSKALYWYEKAAAQSNTNAYFYLAWMYAFGLAVETDQTKAKALYLKAAERGHVWAQSSYADRCDDINEALDWVRRAAENGHRPSWFTLAFTKKYGLSDDEQRYWRRLMAGMNKAMVLMIMGSDYLEGLL